MFNLLRERIRQGLSVRHVHETEHGWQLTQAHRLSGVIEWAPETEGALPLLIVDGRAFTWDQIGRVTGILNGQRAIMSSRSVLTDRCAASILATLDWLDPSRSAGAA